MPNIKSAIKRVSVIENKTLRNNMVNYLKDKEKEYNDESYQNLSKDYQKLISLFNEEIDISVYKTLIDTVSKNLDVLFDYFNIKKQVLNGTANPNRLPIQTITTVSTQLKPITNPIIVSV